jgi:alpha-L-rhamnosidase
MPVAPRLPVASTELRISGLRCEYLTDPEGIDETRPRLSWTLEADRRGVRQCAYRIRVADEPAMLAAGEANLWDSGRVDSDLTAQVPYGGRKLGSRDACFWQVEVWDETGASALSPVGRWTLGLLDPGDWTARWIAPDPEILRRDPEARAPSWTDPGTPALFRREFLLAGPPGRATLFASARGLFEFRLNGCRVGADVLAPEWTDYSKRIHYRAYDVTALLRAGANVLGAVLGDGWWSGYVGWQETRGRYGSIENSLLGQLEVRLGDGSNLVVGTDASWRCNTGPIIASDFMAGEVYDARREQPGWDLPGHQDAAWLGSREVASPAAGLVAQRSEPVRVMETIEPVSTTPIRAGAFLCDLGQNISGWVRLSVRAPAGTRLTLRHGERLAPDGTLYVENLRRAKATDVYVCRGGGTETWEPRFTFHGFQYVEVSSESDLPELSISGRVVRSALPAAGTFTCSHPGVNRLWLNGLWSQRDNFLSIPTDCPQRDERLGWMGDAQVFLRTAAYNMDVAAFMTKWMVDVEDAQTPDGVFPDTAPRLREGENFVGLDGLAGAAGWADAGIIVPWTLWRVYGDTRIVERHWKAMTAWMDWLERENPDGLRVNALGNNYGDWLCLPSDTTFRTHSPMKYLLATAFWADDAAKMARMAAELGRLEESRRFRAMFARVRAAFQREYLRADGEIAVDTQTAYLLALAMDLVPPADRPRAFDRLVANLAAHDWHLSTGFIGISRLNPVLTEGGRADIAYRLLLREDFPSWLYPVVHGATTIWERWNGWTERDGFFNPHMNSFNHYTLGSIGEWLYRHVAGIELDPEVPGFRRFVLHPHPAPGLTSAAATYRTMNGVVASAWSRSGPEFSWKVTVPPNTAARVFIPSEAGTSPTEGGQPLHASRGLRASGRHGSFCVCHVPAGSYVFQSVWNEGDLPSA